MTLYKTKNGVQTGFVPGVGEIVDGYLETDQPLESPTLEVVTDEAEIKAHSDKKQERPQEVTTPPAAPVAQDVSLPATEPVPPPTDSVQEKVDDKEIQ